MRKALVVGCARSVWDEVDAAQKLTKFDAVYCVKQAGIHWPGKFQVWATLHPEYMCGENERGINYIAERKALGLPDGYEIVSPLDGEVGSHAGKCKQSRKVTYRWPGMNASASSGIYAAKIALDDGFERVVLAGIPFNSNAGHFLPSTRNVNNEVRGKVWNQQENFLPGLLIAKKYMAGKVRSMSGYTAEILGSPTREWLHGVTP